MNEDSKSTLKDMRYENGTTNESKQKMIDSVVCVWKPKVSSIFPRKLSNKVVLQTENFPDLLDGNEWGDKETGENKNQS